jgi:hypothetical protein
MGKGAAMTRAELLQRAKGELFNTEMVTAILEGRKTQTRRPVRLKYSNTHLEMVTNKYGTHLYETETFDENIHRRKNADGTNSIKVRATEQKYPKYRKGDIMYVRETFNYIPIPEPLRGTSKTYWYLADDVIKCGGIENTNAEDKWRPSIHMPKEAARIFLRVTDVRVERLQNISESDCICEGISAKGCQTWCAQCAECMVKSQFSALWDSTCKDPNNLFIFNPGCGFMNSSALYQTRRGEHEPTKNRRNPGKVRSGYAGDMARWKWKSK